MKSNRSVENRSQSKKMTEKAKNRSESEKMTVKAKFRSNTFKLYKIERFVFVLAVILSYYLVQWSGKLEGKPFALSVLKAMPISLLAAFSLPPVSTGAIWVIGLHLTSLALHLQAFLLIASIYLSQSAWWALQSLQLLLLLISMGMAATEVSYTRMILSAFAMIPLSALASIDVSMTPIQWTAVFLAMFLLLQGIWTSSPFPSLFYSAAVVSPLFIEGMDAQTPLLYCGTLLISLYSVHRQIRHR